MRHQPKIVRCRFKTEENTIEKLRERFAEQKLSDDEIENIHKAFRHLEGVEVLFSVWDYDSGYRIFSWKKDDDEKIMMAMYYFQKLMYCYELEEFKNIWKSGEWEPECTLVFKENDIEELETLKEES